MSAIVMIASYQSGILNVNAVSTKDIRERLQGIDRDQILSAFESLKSGGVNNNNNQWLQGIDKDQILSAFESLKSGGVNNNQWLQGIDQIPLPTPIALVLFILLVIVGAGFGLGYGSTGDEKNRESNADIQSGGNIPLMTTGP
jgi:hypothetical protein